MVLGDYLVPVGTVLVTPAIEAQIIAHHWQKVVLLTLDSTLTSIDTFLLNTIHGHL